MTTICVLADWKKQAIIKETKENTFFIQCMNGENASRNFPFKSFKTFKWAVRYANNFIF